MADTEEDRVNHGTTTSRNGKASHYRRCCASRTTDVCVQGRQPSQQQRRLSPSEYPNDAQASRFLRLLCEIKTVKRVEPFTIRLIAMGHRASYGITQFYLPPDRGDVSISMLWAYLIDILSLRCFNGRLSLR